MDIQTKLVRKLSEVCSPTTTPVTSWSAKHGPFLQQDRLVQRMCTLVYETKEIKETCKQATTPGIHGIGNIPIPGQWNSSIKLGNWVMHTRTYPRYEVEYKYFDPPEELLDWETGLSPDLIRGDSIQMETDWLKTIAEVADYEVTFDGETYHHDTVINTESLTPGHHVFHLNVKLKSGETRRHEIGFSLLDRVALKFQKTEATLDLEAAWAAGKNGLKMPFTLTNQDRGEVYVHLTVPGVPLGWKAAIPGDTMIHLQKGESKTLELHTEMMSGIGIPQDLTLDFAVSANPTFHSHDNTGGVKYGTAYASVRLKLKLDGRTAKQIINDNAPDQRPKTYGKF